VLAGIAQNGQNDAARVSAAVALLDRGWGRPPQADARPDGDGDIRVTIRHLAGGRDVHERAGKVIEATRVPALIQR
jgi:hypothetical protein